MPFFEIVGVISTWKNYNIAGAFLANEDEQSYVWAIEQLEKLFYMVKREPTCLVTDREKALMNAIDMIFPMAKCLLCRRHVRKNVEDYAKKQMDVFRGTSFANQCMKLFKEESELQYESHLRSLEYLWREHPKVIQYLKRSWLIPYRERIVSAWTNTVFSLGTSTTNRLVHSMLLIVTKFIVLYMLIM